MSIRTALGTALAASLLAGCAGGGPFAKVYSSSAGVAAADFSQDKALAKIEKAVLAEPQAAELRVALANAYLGAGRFQSAVTTFEDAIALGDNSPRSALSLALAYIGAGRNDKATALLEKWRDAIPASDFGLAIALAGEPSRGVAILSDELRGGRADAKLRQNLAYAYALDGRWREARLMVAQDLPADQVDSRISEWAMQGRPEDFSKRVAGLLGAPVRADAGQPAVLALGASRDEPALAAASDPQALDNNARDKELPALDEVESLAASEPSEPEQLLPPVASQVAAPPDPSPEMHALAREHNDLRVATGAEPAHGGREFVTAFAAADATPAPVSRGFAAPGAATSGPVARSFSSGSTGKSGSGYLVQLGAFSSPENADRAWAIYQRRYPGLKQEDLQITEAVVRGRKFWRVAISGYDRNSARTMCSNVRGRGYGCIAYAEVRPLPGSIQQQAGSGPMRARRR